MYINIDELTRVIRNDNSIPSAIRYDWDGIIKYRTYMYKGTQQQHARWLTLDQLLETNQKYIHCINNVKHYDANKHPWIIDYLRILMLWLDENKIQIESFNSQNPGLLCEPLCYTF